MSVSNAGYVMPNFMDLKFKAQRSPQVSMLFGLTKSKEETLTMEEMLLDFSPSTDENKVINRAYTGGPSRKAIKYTKDCMDSI